MSAMTCEQCRELAPELARVLLAAAAAVVVALACGAVAGWLAARPSPEERQYAQVMKDLDGRSLRTASFGVDDPATRTVAYDGDPSWLLVMVDGGVPDGEYAVVCDYQGGWSLSPGKVTVRDGRGTWSTTVNRTLSDLTDVRLQDAAGDQVAHATFD
jgi:hypothetical protein